MIARKKWWIPDWIYKFFSYHSPIKFMTERDSHGNVKRPIGYKMRYFYTKFQERLQFPMEQNHIGWDDFTKIIGLARIKLK